MFIRKKYNVIGIMSGTSIDGLDCSFMKTDGENFVSIKFEKTYKYSQNYRNKLKKIIKYFNNKRLIKINQYLKNNEEYEIDLIFNNNAHISLSAETIEVRLEDQTN